MERQPKRVHQACLNCRRKKTRCPGERPICSFCARLQQDRQYDGSWLPSNEADRLTLKAQTLAARVATIESQLSMITLSSFGEPGNSSLVWNTPLSQVGSSGSHPVKLNFGGLLDTATIQSAVDTYFRYCHCQPYCYFQEENFRRGLAENTLPPWLLLAVIATAAGFSNDGALQGRHNEASDYFASVAWKDINGRMFQEEDFMTIHTVQAANMLSVIDFAGIPSQPHPSLSLSHQEEHQKTAWSKRTPTLQDADCTLGLPISPDFRSSATPEDVRSLGSPGVLYLIASALGRVQRCWLRWSPQSATHFPWKTRSEFASIYSSLLTCESCLAESLSGFDSALDKEIVNTRGKTKIDPALGLLCFSHAIYFLSQCLLYYPFLFRCQLQSVKALIPLSFLRHVLLTCHKNVKGLSRVLRRLCVSSFISYYAVVTGATHRLYGNYDDPTIRPRRRIYAESPGASRLQPSATSAMVSPSVYNNLPHHPNMEEIWKLLDYGRLSERGREASPARNISTQMENIGPSDFDTSLLNFDITIYGLWKRQQRTREHMNATAGLNRLEADRSCKTVLRRVAARLSPSCRAKYRL
ncbi:fungal-specific transcription factor domain-containing protein [Xylaria digitata]|nr:fungal-specific transcription factor domain-containing protein [Xylaria digitata]